MRRVGEFFLLSALALAQPPRAVAPAPGVFLVAKPSIDGGPFWQSVVLLLAHGDEGTLGIIVNRATDIPLSKVLSNLDKESVDPSLHFGGPVGLDGLLFLFESDEPPKDAKSVMDGVYYSGDREVLQKLLKKKADRDPLKVYLGHAGWAPGQLQGEILRGSWSLVWADAFTVFRKSPDAIWPELAGSGATVAGFLGKFRTDEITSARGPDGSARARPLARPRGD
jgi:putative transcriptional regulator